FVNLAWNANYKQGDAIRLEFTGPNVGARTTGRLMAAATAQLMRRGVVAAQAGQITGLNSTIRSAMERHLPVKRDKAVLEGDKGTELLTEALRHITEQLMSRGVDPRTILDNQ
ncbi:hypothetical protein VaNZ11_001365, partial [Volvox africanus]